MKATRRSALFAASLLLTLTLLPASAAETRPSSTPKPATGITVTMSCTQDSISCEAVASGGSGNYSFVWTNATEGVTDGNYSEAAPHCWSGHTKFTVSVAVTDDASGSGSASKYFVCP